MKYKKHIEQSFESAENNISKLPDKILKFRGMSGVKTRHLYNNLCNLEGINYLEVGLYTGSTFISAIFNNNINCTGIDNWSLKPEAKDLFEERLDKYKEGNNVNCIENDCFDIDASSLGKFDIYLYDGKHGE